MSGVNKVILVGNVGKDPEIRYLESNVPVAKFTLATNEVYRNKEGQKVEQTEWHNIVMWRWLAETAEKYVRKGSLLYIEGKIKTRSYDDKDGNKRYITEVVVESFKMLDRKGDGGGSGSGSSYSSSPSVEDSPASTAAVDDDLPF